MGYVRPERAKRPANRPKWPLQSLRRPVWAIRFFEIHDPGAFDEHFFNGLLERRHHEVEAAEKFSRHGHSANFGFTNEGIPTLTASLLDGVLALKSPAAAQIPDEELEGFSRQLTALLAQGVKVRLAPVQLKSHPADTK